MVSALNMSATLLGFMGGRGGMTSFFSQVQHTEASMAGHGRFAVTTRMRVLGTPVPMAGSGSMTANLHLRSLEVISTRQLIANVYLTGVDTDTGFDWT
jgi:hypothetical protein